MDADVVVVGAGLAGLRCATELVRAGLDVVVLEAADTVGGRIRTDAVDGFLVDRGFQLLNPAYPAVRRWVDVDALALQSFGAGVAARADAGLLRLGHPLRAPRLIPSTLAAVRGEAREVLALVRWLRPLAHGPRTTSRAALQARPDTSLRDSLDRAGLRGTLRHTVDRFFAGVLLEDAGASSASFARLLTAMFVRGVPGLPRDGMQALPRLVGVELENRVCLDTPVGDVRPTAGGFIVDAGGTPVSARHVVVATGAGVAHELTGLPAVATNGVVSHWFATPTSPSASALLHVDARAAPTGPLVNTAVVSNAAPSYAPGGQHLVAASALLRPGRPVPSEAEMRHHAGQLFGCPTDDWRTVARHEIPHALPAQLPPMLATQPVELDGGLVVCGDHRDTASIQGALVSGHRAAAALLRRR